MRIKERSLLLLLLYECDNIYKNSMLKSMEAQ